MMDRMGQTCEGDRIAYIVLAEIRSSADWVAIIPETPFIDNWKSR